jgi:hypothetical protein
VRTSRRNKITKLLTESVKSPDEEKKVYIKKGPVSVETSLTELEAFYMSRPEWKVIENGGVLSVPVEEFRLENPPQPDHSGRVSFGKKKGGGNKIDHYTVGQTVNNLNECILRIYNDVKEKTRAAGKSATAAESEAKVQALKLPQFQALKTWQDTNAEINLKRAMEKMARQLKIPALIIRSINLKAVSALKDLGLNISGDAEIDLIMAYISGDFLQIVLAEIKRSDRYPWQHKCGPPNKQAVNKAENQLTKDLDIMMTILTGIPPSRIIFRTLACYPETPLEELQAIFCADCLETMVCKEDVEDLCLLQRKTKVPDQPTPPSTIGKQHLLTLSARCLSHQSWLHVGYRDVQDKEKLATAKHKYNLESVDGKIREFVVASPQQQEVLNRFSSSLIERHLVLEGPAGTRGPEIP